MGEWCHLPNQVYEDRGNAAPHSGHEAVRLHDGAKYHT